MRKAGNVKVPANETAKSWFLKQLSEGIERGGTTVVAPPTVQYGHYAENPVGFCEDILGESLTDDVKIMMESVRDNPVTIAKSGNAVGKTHGAARVAVWFYKSHPGAQVYTAAAPPEDNLKRLLWGELGSLVEKHKATVFQDDKATVLNVARNAREFITGVTVPMSGSESEREARFSGKHAPYLLFIIDEGDAVPDEVYAGIESCMSGGHARLLVMFNPRFRSGPVYMKERNKAANVVPLSAVRHPNVVSGEDLIPGAVTRDMTVRRINEWTRPAGEGDPDEGDGVFEIPDFLVGAIAKKDGGGFYSPLQPQKRIITEGSFSYMVLGKYPDKAENQLISAAWVDAAFMRYRAYVTVHGEVFPSEARVIMGVDVGEYGSDPSMVAMRYGGLVLPFIEWRGVDTEVSADKVAELANKHLPMAINVDSNGIGAGVAPKLARKGYFAHRVMVSEKPDDSQNIRTELGEFSQLRDQLYWAIREWLRTDPSAMLPPDEILREELLAPLYNTDERKVKVTPKKELRQRLKRSINRMDALALTFYQPPSDDGCPIMWKDRMLGLKGLQAERSKVNAQTRY